MTDDEIKQVQELYEWHADHLDYRAPALAALLREHAAMKAVVEAAQKVSASCNMALVQPDDDHIDNWRKAQDALDAALEALAKEQG